MDGTPQRRTQWILDFLNLEITRVKIENRKIWRQKWRLQPFTSTCRHIWTTSAFDILASIDEQIKLSMICHLLSWLYVIGNDIEFYFASFYECYGIYSGICLYVCLVCITPSFNLSTFQKTTAMVSLICLQMFKFEFVLISLKRVQVITENIKFDF